MVDLGGMSALDAWTATTLSAAELMGLAGELGTLEPGKRADVVLLSGSFDDLDKLGERVVGVWKDGVRAV
jgi:imidazolonepropionase-like amidohydrolase